MRKPLTRVFRRAGCGKSARPVRRGESGPHRKVSPSLLLYRPNLFAEFLQKRTHAFHGHFTQLRLLAEALQPDQPRLPAKPRDLPLGIVARVALRIEERVPGAE